MSEAEIEVNADVWTPCSAACDGGRQTRTADCVMTDATGLVKPTDAAACAALNLPVPLLERSCNTQPCATVRPVRIGANAIMSVSELGLPETHQATGLHVLATYAAKNALLETPEAAASTAKAVAAAEALQSAAPKGVPAVWVAGAWGACAPAPSSPAAPYGVQTRNVTCTDIPSKSAVKGERCYGEARSATVRACVRAALCTGAGMEGCSGKGVCTAGKCACARGYWGSLCQIPPTCGTAVNARLQCCPSEHVSVTTGVIRHTRTLLVSFIRTACAA